MISDEHQSKLSQRPTVRVHHGPADQSAQHGSDAMIVREVRQRPSEAFDERPSNQRLSADDLQGRAFTLLEQVGATIANETR